MVDKKKEVLGWGFEVAGTIYSDVFANRTAAREYINDSEYAGGKVIRVKVQKYVKK